MVGISGREASGVARRGVGGGENERFDFAARSDAAEEGETGIGTSEEADFVNGGIGLNGAADKPEAARPLASRTKTLPDGTGTLGKTFGREIGLVEDVHGADDIDGDLKGDKGGMLRDGKAWISLV